MVLDVDHSARLVKIPGSQGNHVKDAFEDVRFAVDEDCLTQQIREFDNALDRCLNNEIVNTSNNDLLSTDNEYCRHDDTNATSNNHFDALFDQGYSSDNNDHQNRNDGNTVRGPLEI